VIEIDIEIVIEIEIEIETETVTVTLKEILLIIAGIVDHRQEEEVPALSRDAVPALFGDRLDVLKTNSMKYENKSEKAVVLFRFGPALHLLLAKKSRPAMA